MCKLRRHVYIYIYIYTRISICRAIVNTKIHQVKKQIAKPSWSFGASNIVLTLCPHHKKIDGKKFLHFMMFDAMHPAPCTLPPSHR